MVGPAPVLHSSAGSGSRGYTQKSKPQSKARCCSWHRVIIFQCFFAGMWCVLVMQRLYNRLDVDRMVTRPTLKTNLSYQSRYIPPPKAASSFWKTTKPSFANEDASTGNRKPAIQAFALSVNHLQKIDRAEGALPEQVAAPEDFLPVVVNDNIQLRFRLKAVPGAGAWPSREISAYQITALYVNTKKVVWDSGKVSATSMPDHVPWGGPQIPVGSIVEWKVSIWDHAMRGPSQSVSSKFAVGPSDDQFQSKWIVHPKDQSLFLPDEIKQFFHGNKEPGVQRWKDRRPLPLARAKVDLTSSEATEIVSAMLVVSGLGAFSASVDGKPLSSSSAMDPPLTEFSLRISYRGYDVSQFFAGKKNAGSHIIGVTLGSGWFDARPLDGGIIKHHLLPRGPLTTIAELHVTTKDGTTKILAPTGHSGSGWQMAKGYLLDSDIFTGDVTDLGRQHALQNWDTPSGWSESGSVVGSTDITWVEAASYKSNIDTSKWREIITGRAVDTAPNVEASFDTAPLGKLVPIEAPPVMPVERMPVESISNLGDGRWILDFGKAISGVVRFDDGLPKPIKPNGEYPRAHTYPTSDEYISVIYAENIQMETGDLNLVLVAGMGLHDGGARKTRGDPNERAGPGYPKDHGTILAQRDVFVAPKDNLGLFSTARKSSFTTHGFRFAEICCSETPPTNAHAVLYRTAFEEWGTFESSHVNLNGAHELIRNAFNSNLLGVQSDCPHREKLQYGGDLMADSPAAMHLYDMGAFYNKVIHDWTDVQWSNGAYTETTPWHDLNDYAGIGHGAGETVWASLPVILTARHMQHYGELKLLQDSLDQHVKWMKFLRDFWETKNWEQFGGLGDWLSVHNRDTFLTHHAYFMATSRSIAYIANHLAGIREDSKEIVDDAMHLATLLTNWLVNIYMQKTEKGMSFTKNNHGSTPSADLGLFARIVPGQDRCGVLQSFVETVGSGKDRLWHGGEEMRQYGRLSDAGKKKAAELGMMMKDEGKRNVPIYRLGYNTFEGILAIRFTLRTLSDMGFHDVAVNKVAGIGFPSVEYMLSHNATTMWETWWRSEDVFSRNHPMLGAIAEWLPTSVAGISLAPRTIGGRELLFWPRIPTTNKLVYASSTQGTKRGTAAIAWRFADDLTKSGTAFPKMTTVQIRLLVPPSSFANFRVPFDGLTQSSTVVVEYASTLPDFDMAKNSADRICKDRRSKGLGFGYNWDYDRKEDIWDIKMNGKAIGTPCESFLFDKTLTGSTKWSKSDHLVVENKVGAEVPLRGGFYEIRITQWKVNQYAELHDNFKVNDIGPYCNDTETYEWDLADALYLI